jgi:hypothetical protein
MVSIEIMAARIFGNLGIHNNIDLFICMVDHISPALLFSTAVSASNCESMKILTKILFMVPIYGFCSLLSFVFLNHSVLISLFRDVYEGYVVYNFFWLFLEYLGPNAEARWEILSSKGLYTCPPPFLCFKYSPANVHFFSRCKLGSRIDLI